MVILPGAFSAPIWINGATLFLPTTRWSPDYGHPARSWLASERERDVLSRERSSSTSSCGLHPRRLRRADTRTSSANPIGVASENGFGYCAGFVSDYARSPITRANRESRIVSLVTVALSLFLFLLSTHAPAIRYPWGIPVIIWAVGKYFRTKRASASNVPSAGIYTPA